MLHALWKSIWNMSMSANVQKWWKVKGPCFLFPPCFPGHKHKWAKISIDECGCEECGIVHCCSSPSNIVNCVCEMQEDSSVVYTHWNCNTNTTLFTENTRVKIFAIAPVSQWKQGKISGCLCATNLTWFSEDVVRSSKFVVFKQRGRKQNEGIWAGKKRLSCFSPSCSAMRCNISNKHSLCLLTLSKTAFTRCKDFVEITQSHVHEMATWDDFVTHLSFTLMFIGLRHNTLTKPVTTSEISSLLAFTWPNTSWRCRTRIDPHMRVLSTFYHSRFFCGLVFTFHQRLSQREKMSSSSVWIN